MLSPVAKAFESNFHYVSPNLVIITMTWARAAHENFVPEPLKTHNFDVFYAKLQSPYSLTKSPPKSKMAQAPFHHVQYLYKLQHKIEGHKHENAGKTTPDFQDKWPRFPSTPLPTYNECNPHSPSPLFAPAALDKGCKRHPAIG